MVNATDQIEVSQSRILLEDGTEIFYRYAGRKDYPPFLLLHGMPASSYQYRNLLRTLASKYFVIAPDLPGFGFTHVPANYRYTFNNLSQTIERFINKLELKGIAVYIFDYGAPVAMRIFLRKPSLFRAIVTQNGNAYTIGLGPAWQISGIQKYWEEPTKANEDALRSIFEYEMIKSQYTEGHPNPSSIPPETYTLDYYHVNARTEAMLDLFGDYKENVKLYPQFAQALRDAAQRGSLEQILAIWGKHDPFFVPAGAEAFKNDVPNTKVILLDAGHFALESHIDQISNEILSTLK